MRKSLSIIIPVFNEQENIPTLIERLNALIKKDLAELNVKVLLVDDGSSDESLSIIKSKSEDFEFISYLSFSRNFGHHNAIAAGIQSVNTDFVVLMDGDLQDRPESIPLLYDEMSKGFDLVLAQRASRRGGYIKRATSSLFWKSIRMLSGLHLVPEQSIMRIFNRKVLVALQSIKESNRFYSALFSWVGFSKSSVIVPYDERFAGTTKYSAKKLFSLALKAVFGFSRFPSILVTALGIALMLGAGGLSLLNVSGWFLPIFLTGLIILTLGIVSLRIGQLLADSRERPLYIIKEQSN